MKLIESIREDNEIPETWKEAAITLISKEGTDIKDVRNYRPISLLN